MNKRLIFLSLILLIFCNACSKKSPSTADKYVSDSQPSSLAADEAAVDTTGERSKTESKPESLQGWFAQKGDIENQRLLEYTIDIVFETNDFAKSRDILLTTIKKHGFLRSSNLESDESKNLTTSFNIKTDSLYSVLNELNSIGTIKRENIATVDHTLGNIRNLIQQRREQIRSERRLYALTESDATRQNYEKREQYLSQSEDALDENEYQMKFVDDAVAWVKINVSITQKSRSVFTVPDFREAFVTMVEMFLKILYLLIVLLPYILIIIATVLLRKPIAALYHKISGRKKQ